MLAILRGRAEWRGALGVLALLAIIVKLASPPGFMPGSSLAAPIIVCPGQGVMPGMETAHRDHAPSKAPHDAADHPCAFAGLAVAPLIDASSSPDLAPLAVELVVIGSADAIAPGRGLAAPPPPSRAPPTFRT